MRSLRWVLVLAVVVWAIWASSCGAASTEGTIDPTGGEVCYGDRLICLFVPSGGLERPTLFRLGPSTDSAGGALGEVYEIVAPGQPTVTFLKPARVSVALEPLADSGVDEQLFRIFSRSRSDCAVDPNTCQWIALEKAALDRVRGAVQGETTHLSSFAVMRADRLPDGGLPVDIDAGPRDSGVIVIPPCTVGCADAGRDAGRPDAGPPDAGPPDAGPPDAGPPDAGSPDAGSPDAGSPDAGAPDSGTPDAGGPDAGSDGGADGGDGG